MDWIDIAEILEIITKEQKEKSIRNICEKSNKFCKKACTKVKIYYKRAIDYIQVVYEIPENQLIDCLDYFAKNAHRDHCDLSEKVDFSPIEIVTSFKLFIFSQEDIEEDLFKLVEQSEVKSLTGFDNIFKPSSKPESMRGLPWKIEDVLFDMFTNHKDALFTFVVHCLLNLDLEVTRKVLNTLFKKNLLKPSLPDSHTNLNKADIKKYWGNVLKQIINESINNLQSVHVKHYEYANNMLKEIANSVIKSLGQQHTSQGRKTLVANEAYAKLTEKSPISQIDFALFRTVAKNYLFSKINVRKAKMRPQYTHVEDLENLNDEAYNADQVEYKDKEPEVKFTQAFNRIITEAKKKNYKTKYEKLKREPKSADGQKNSFVPDNYLPQIATEHGVDILPDFFKVAFERLQQSRPESYDCFMLFLSENSDSTENFNNETQGTNGVGIYVKIALDLNVYIIQELKLKNKYNSKIYTPDIVKKEITKARGFHAQNMTLEELKQSHPEAHSCLNIGLKYNDKLLDISDDEIQELGKSGIFANIALDLNINIIQDLKLKNKYNIKAYTPDIVKKEISKARRFLYNEFEKMKKDDKDLD